MEPAVLGMTIGAYEFRMHTAYFRYITDSSSGPGWDFSFAAKCVNDNPERPLFPYGARLYTEAAPLPLENVPNLTGKEIVLGAPFDEDTGEPYFGLKVWEEHEVSGLKMRFVRKKENTYLIELDAIVSKTVFGYPEKLHLVAWAEQQKENAYP